MRSAGILYRTSRRYEMTRRLLLAVLAGLVTAPPATAQETPVQTGSLSGAVVDPAGTALADVTVSLVGETAAVRTDAAGRFALRGGPGGGRAARGRRGGGRGGGGRGT